MEYLVVALGSATLGAVLMTLDIYICRFLLVICARRHHVGIGLEGIYPIILGAFLGSWIGETLGCWLCLHFFGYQNAVLTTVLLAVLTPLGFCLWLLVIFTGKLEPIGGLNSPNFLLLAGLTLVALPLLARLLSNPGLMPILQVVLTLLMLSPLWLLIIGIAICIAKSILIK
jgi:hypothetical protein